MTMDFDFALPYMLSGHHCEEIRQEDIGWGNLVYAGKIMSLSTYGDIGKDLYKNNRRML